MRIDPKIEIYEISHFFDSFNSGIRHTNPIYRSDEYRVWVRKLIALQIVASCYPHPLETAKRYFRECFSDAISAFSLAHLGYYKSADHLMRSAIENLCRAVLINSGHSKLVRKVKDTRELFKLFAQKSSSDVASDFGEMRRCYGPLSEAVHTSKPSHMALRSALGDVAKFSRERFVACSEMAVPLLHSFLAIIFMDYVDIARLRRLRPVYLQDFFLDNVRATLKRKKQDAV
jgi:hypothetical protein